MAWYEIRDFRPGIYSVPGISHPPGAATERNTFRCTAVESGALVPGPRLVSEITHDAITTGVGLRSHGGWYISGFRAAGPVNTVTGATGRDIDLNRDELFFGFEWYEEANPPTANTQWTFQVESYRRNLVTPDWTILDPYPDAEANSLTAPYPAYVSMDYTRANPADPTEVGAPVVAMVPYRREPYCWPNPAPGNTNTHLDIIDSGDSGDTDGRGNTGDANKPVEWLLAHQGRIVLFPLIPFGAGRASPSHTWSNSEAYYFTTVNDPTSMDTNVGFFDQIFGMEIPSGFATGGSMTADELFILKRKGGALMLRGDLADPTVVHLPNVRSPGFSQNQGIRSPLGFVYCCENGGVWSWEGGDTSQPLSRQMRADFWRPKFPPRYENSIGNFDVSPTQNFLWQDRVHVPNNWYIDTVHLGWWKIWPNEEDREWGVNYGESFYLGDNGYDDRLAWFTPRMFFEDGGTVAYEFDERKRSQFFSWQSHPIQASIDREIRTSEVSVTASGYGRVTVTLRGKSGNTRTISFDFDNEFPQRIVERLQVKDSLVQIHLESESVSYGQDGENSDDEAPTIHAVGVNLMEGNTV